MKDVPTTDSNTTEFVSIHAQLELSSPTDIVPEDAILTTISGKTSVTLNVQLELA